MHLIQLALRTKRPLCTPFIRAFSRPANVLRRLVNEQYRPNCGRFVAYRWPRTWLAHLAPLALLDAPPRHSSPRTRPTTPPPDSDHTRQQPPPVSAVTSHQTGQDWTGRARRSRRPRRDRSALFRDDSSPWRQRSDRQVGTGADDALCQYDGAGSHLVPGGPGGHALWPVVSWCSECDGDGLSDSHWRTAQSVADSHWGPPCLSPTRTGGPLCLSPGDAAHHATTDNV